MSSLAESPSTPPGGDASDPLAAETSTEALLRCIDRIKLLIEDENRLLRNGSPFDLERFNQRKARALIELSRAGDALPSQLPSETSGRLQSFRAKLAENGELLGLHLRATREIAELIVAAIRREQSDGTYSFPALVVKA